MIEFNNISQEIPYLLFKEFYDKSLSKKQKNVEAICIASYSPSSDEVQARFVNLKFVNEKKLIFFNNYNSPKASEFFEHNPITGLIYWNEINVQIRMKAKIKKTSKKFSQAYFAQRNKKKNALAISSNQSKVISSYKDVEKKYDESLLKKDLSKCPKHWGGYYFIPYYFEFWKGHKDRLNKRDAYKKLNGKWIHSCLEP